MSGIAIANLKLKPTPPSSMFRQSPGKPDTSSAIKMTFGSIFFASKLAHIKYTIASSSKFSLKY